MTSNNASINKIGLAILLVALLPGCSVKRLAVNQIGDALAGSGVTFSSDNDPDLVRDALPFTLKLVESVLAESPEHSELRIAAAAYFTQYAYGFLQLEADYEELANYEQADHLRYRAKNMFLRGRDHGLRELERHHGSLRTALNEAPGAPPQNLAKHTSKRFTGRRPRGLPPSLSARMIPTSSPSCRKWRH